VFRTALQASSTLSAQWHRRWLSCVLLLLVALPSLSVRAEIFSGEELKDPTRPAGAAPVVEAEGEAGFLDGLFGSAASLLNSNYKVTFVRAGGAEPVAMINERLVKAGDMIGEAEVIAIDAQSVSLRVNGGIQRVTSYTGTVKTLAEPQ
jgi:hypothetical protein